MLSGCPTPGALREGFALGPAEERFLRSHRSYDRRCVAAHLATYIANALGAPDALESCARGTMPAALGAAPEPATRILLRDAGTALRMRAFFDALVNVSKETPYPYASS